MTLNAILRHVLSIGIAIFVAITAYFALSGPGSAPERASSGISDTALTANAAGRFALVDAGLSGAGQRLAAQISAGPEDLNTVFNAAAGRFFQQSSDARALVFFQRTNSQQDAAAIARPVADGIAQFQGREGPFFLAPAFVLAAPGTQPGVFPLSGRDGRLPFDLVASDAAQRALSGTMSADAPTSSQLLVTTADGVKAVSAVSLGEDDASLWRMTPIRAATLGGDVIVGVLGALIDANAVFGSPEPGTRLSGPVEAISALSARGDLPVNVGAQGYLLATPDLPAFEPEEGSGFAAIGAAIAGLLTLAMVAFIRLGDHDALRAMKQKLSAQQKKYKRTLSTNKRNEERFKRLAESTNVIPWSADLSEGRFVYIGPQIRELTGYPARSWCAAGFWVDHIHPEDRPRIVAEGFGEVGRDDYATLEYRVRTSDGRTIHIRNTMKIDQQRSAKTGKRKTYAQGFMLDITDVKTASDMLEGARREAESANRTKSEFLANMSHELRTPLNAVIGFSEVMKDELFGPMGDRYKDYADSVYASGKHLLDLINDVLDLSKIEAGKIELIEEETDIGSLLARCRSLLHDRASSAGLHIRLEIPAPLPMAIIDSRRVKQVIINLMSNSVKFTPPGGRISLRGEMVPGTGLCISVADTGIGMTQDEIEIALKQFGQIDNELSRHHQGTGLGLPIARSLAELHDGKLKVESKKGQGTQVTLVLPPARLVKSHEEMAS